MAGSLRRLYRRARYGRPIVVVSGLPRSGTSLMMQMLEAGGLEMITDRIRGADESNPQGYYELEEVKDLENGGDLSWLAGARGRAVKIIAFLLRFLPRDYNYAVIFMHRDLEEVIASQRKMLLARGEPAEDDDGRMRDLFQDHLDRARRLLANRPYFDVLDVSYNDVIRGPEAQAARVSEFLAGRLETDRMAAVVDPQLYRNRN